MIISAEVAPSFLLAPFVRCYSFREFDTMGTDLVKPWHASHEICITFCFKAKPLQFTNGRGELISKEGRYGGVIGSGTKYNGEFTFRGYYSFFEISFKANGFSRIFGIPASEITNQVMEVDDILDSTGKTFYEQLSTATALSEMAALADEYLLHHFKSQKVFERTDAITGISTAILHTKELVSIERLASRANMSPRNFERQFTEQLGVSPKLFSCITRFNHALACKLKDPKKDWTAIASELGYFDQMHLIKDFKRFAGTSPSHFLKQTPMTKESYTSRVDE